MGEKKKLSEDLLKTKNAHDNYVMKMLCKIKRMQDGEVGKIMQG